MSIATLPVTALFVLILQAPQPPYVLTAADDFRAGLERYVALRQRVESTLPPLRVTDDPAEILKREQALAATVRAARRQARQGEIFTAAAGADFSQIIAADRMRRSAEAAAALVAEVPLAVPGVNEPYPEGAPLATFPALLLAELPPLPEDLEYRFMGRYLIIRDARTNLVVDYLLELTAPRQRR